MAIKVNIDINDFTQGSFINDFYEVEGKGTFDTMMSTATKHLTAQLEMNRFRGEDYADAYIEIYKATLAAALEAWLHRGKIEAETAKLIAETEMIPTQIEMMEKQIALAEKQLELLEKQIETEQIKANLHKRQIEGFDEEYKHKILKLLLDSWAVGFSVARDSFLAGGMPAPLQKATIDNLYNEFVLTDLDKYKYDRPDGVEL